MCRQLGHHVHDELIPGAAGGLHGDGGGAVAAYQLHQPALVHGGHQVVVGFRKIR